MNWKTATIEEKRAYWRKKAAQYRIDHPDRVAATNKRSYQKHYTEKRANQKRYASSDTAKARARSRSLMNRYGMTIDSWNQLFDRQNGTCAICKTNLEKLESRHVHVDHDHVTNAIRGILCHNCNTMIGLARDNSEILNAAINYLRKQA